MVTNADYLIQKYAEAREKMETYPSNDSGFNYWRGVMDTYHNLLSSAFPGWANEGTVGRLVFIYQKTYDEALAACEQNLIKQEI
jgi:hypothetical protein